MPLILRAIITGFGYKLGAELGRYVATKIGLIDRGTAKKEESEEELPDGITVDYDDGDPDGDPDGDGEDVDPN